MNLRLALILVLALGCGLGCLSEQLIHISQWAFAQKLTKWYPLAIPKASLIALIISICTMSIG